jgi:cold shock CspA family protein
MSAEKLTGKSKFFDSVKGFGFLIPDDGSAEVFVHQTAIHANGYRSLADNELVEYDLCIDNGKRAAANVTG